MIPSFGGSVEEPVVGSPADIAKLSN